MKTKLIELLVQNRKVLMDELETDEQKIAYYNAFLLTNYGIVLDQPNRASASIIKQIGTIYKVSVPDSFYSNPQDTKYFTADELLLEQIASYFIHECINPDFGRLELFSKLLPNYTPGTEVVFRRFNVLPLNRAHEFLAKLADDYCAYTRPWSISERDNFIALYNEGYYNKNKPMLCKDNIFNLIEFCDDFSQANRLDYKDVVKYSVNSFPSGADLRYVKDLLAFTYPCKNLGVMMSVAKPCPLSKKQAKYFNKIRKDIAVFYDQSVANSVPIVTNIDSPFRLANVEMQKGNVVEAAKIFAKNGSLLERNLVYLLSRANAEQAIEILDLVSDSNPIALAQIVSKINSNSPASRTFTFKRRNKVVSHTETNYETTYKKSVLSGWGKSAIKQECMNKFSTYYQKLPSLGKIYISEEFKQVAIPFNTSASGTGIDVLSTGSRTNLESSKVRSFVYWKDAYDIDASLILVDADGKLQTIYYGNYSHKMNDAIRFSGDCRNKEGAEYYDLDLDLLHMQGYRYIIQTINGFESDLNGGEIKAGYQAKEDFDTTAWDAKNIAYEYTVKGDSREAINFAIDLETYELITLNLVGDGQNHTVSEKRIYAMVKQYLSQDYLFLNMYELLKNRGQVVNNPEIADIIFDDEYSGEKETIRTYNTEKLITYLK